MGKFVYYYFYKILFYILHNLDIATRHIISKENLVMGACKEEWQGKRACEGEWQGMRACKGEWQGMRACKGEWQGRRA